MPLTVLDGPMGTRLGELGVPLPAPLWSAWALLHAPDRVREVHASYARAGAEVHTANTFRVHERQAGARWRELLGRAVALAREAAGPHARVAGSIAPLEDCYRPDLSPPDPRPEHRQLARGLAAAGVDLLLVETFPHVGEALVAVEEAVATGLPTWVSFTAGPEADLLTPDQVREGAIEAARRGAQAVLVNCIPVPATAGFLDALAPAGLPYGAYANAGRPDEGMGWGADPVTAAAAYARQARAWCEHGATLLGACCGTGPEHVRALAALAREEEGP